MFLIIEIEFQKLILVAKVLAIIEYSAYNVVLLKIDIYICQHWDL